MKKKPHKKKKAIQKKSGPVKKTSGILAVISLLSALGSGIAMKIKNNNQELWGHLPLVFFASLWAALFFFIIYRHANKPDKIQKYLLAAASGLLLWAAFPPSPLAPLAFIAFIPLLIVERQLRPAGKKQKKAERFFPFLYLSFLLWNILTTYWVANSALVAGALAITINSLFMSIPWMLWRWTKKKSPRIGLFILPAYWIAFEYVHLHWEISWPWLTLGHAFALYPSLVQWYEYTGVLGGSLWIWLGNLAVWELLPLTARTSRTALLPALRLALILLLPVLLSIQRYRHYTERNSLGKEVEVVVVQPNYEPHYEKFTTPWQKQLERYLSLAEQLISDSTDYLVFPETSFGNFKDEFIGRKGITKPLKEWVEAHPNIKLISGLGVFHVFGKGEKVPASAQTIIDREGKKLYWEPYNAAVLLQAGVEKAQIYKKSRLVPAAEFLPYHNILFFFKPLVDKLGGTVNGYGAQEKRTPLKAKGDSIAIGTQICYESIYGEFSTGYAREGANLLFIMTNDGWWDNTPGHRQHLWFGRLRAIELRRDIARSANTGISAFINQRGDISQATPYGQTAVIKAQLNPNDQLTFYALHGDIIGRLAAFVSLLFLFKTLVESFITKNKKDIT